MRIAAIDVGSNSIHMVVAQVEADGRFRVLDRAKEMVRLGHRTFKNGRLSDQAVQAGLQTLSAFRTLAERQGATRFKAVATSAVREAANGGDFVRLVQEQVGLRVKVIPGREEARLVHLGVSYAIDLRGAPALVVDAGGGSVELILTEDEKAVEMESLKLGVTRLAEKYLAEDPPTPKNLARLRETLANKLDPVLESIAKRHVPRVVGTSGTLLNLVSIIGYLRGDPPNGHLNHYSVSSQEISKVRRMLAKSDRAGRLRIKGLDAKRADTIVVGAFMADHILRRLGASEMIACTWALREGVLLDFISRHRKGIEETERYSDVRQRGVARFARHLGEFGEHGDHVSDLALQLFDQLRDRLPALPPEAREWLDSACRLHDVGHHISHRNHQRHTYYLIANGELLGFRKEEVEIIAQVARYHRKAPPKDTDEEFRLLSKRDQETVRTLSALLRVADGLDRTRYAVVKRIVVTRRPGRMILQLHTRGEDAEIELWEAQRRAGLLQRVLDTEIDFRIAS